MSIIITTLTRAIGIAVLAALIATLPAGLAVSAAALHQLSSGQQVCVLGTCGVAVVSTWPAPTPQPGGAGGTSVYVP